MSKPKLANILQTPIIYTLWYNYVYNTYTQIQLIVRLTNSTSAATPIFNWLVQFEATNLAEISLFIEVPV